MGTTGKPEIATASGPTNKDQEAKEKPLCFVISQIGPDGSPERERADKVLRHVIEKPLSSKYKVERADEIGKPGLITVQIIQRLASADLVVADLTGGNPNVYYELALRHYFAKPVVHIIQRGQKAPFDVSPMRYVEFDLGDPDVLDTAREELLSHVVAMENGAKAVTLVQVAEVFSEASEEQGDENKAMLTAIYGALGNLQEHVTNVAVKVVDSLRPQPLLGGAGIGSRSSTPFGNIGRSNLVNPLIPNWGETNVVAPSAHVFGSVSDLVGAEPMSRAGSARSTVEPNMLTPGSPSHVAVPQPRPAQSPTGEQPNKEPNQGQHRMHAPSRKRTGAGENE